MPCTDSAFFCYDCGETQATRKIIYQHGGILKDVLRQLLQVAVHHPLPLCAALESEAARKSVSFREIVVEKKTLYPLAGLPGNEDAQFGERCGYLTSFFARWSLI